MSYLRVFDINSQVTFIFGSLNVFIQEP